MRKPYKSYVCQTLGELNELLGWMMIHAPTFTDRSGHFPEQNIDTEFQALNESFDVLRTKLGEERYAKMREMSAEMRALFEADPESKTGQTIEGCRIIYEMELMLRRKRAVSLKESDRS
jgi:hypothetical protein